MKNKDNNNKNNKKKILLLLLLLLLMVGGFFVYKIFFDKKTEIATVVAGDFLPEGKDASKMTEKELTKYAQQAVDTTNFNMRIVSEAHFNNETMTGDLAMQNPPQNSQPINVVVTLNSDNSTIYESGAIQPGEEIKEVTLTQKLNPGTYPVTATFNIYNSNTKRKQGEVKALLTLIVDK